MKMVGREEWDGEGKAEVPGSVCAPPQDPSLLPRVAEDPVP